MNVIHIRKYESGGRVLLGLDRKKAIWFLWLSGMAFRMGRKRERRPSHPPHARSVLEETAVSHAMGQV